METTIKKLLLLAVIAFAMSFQAKAQFHFGINALGSHPLSHWADTGTANFGVNPYMGNAAKFGAGIGFRFQYDFSWRYNGIVSPFVDIDGMWNPKNESTKQVYDKKSCTLAHYINIPIMVGATYRYFPNYQRPIIGFFAEGALGADILFVTQEGWAGNPQTYKPSTAFAIRIGGGICLTPQLNLGVHYTFLGNHKIDKNTEGNEFPQEIKLRIPEKLKESVLTLKLTYIIKGNKMTQLPIRNSPL